MRRNGCVVSVPVVLDSSHFYNEHKNEKYDRDPHQCEKQDPDQNQSEKSWIRIRIKVKFRARIRMKVMRIHNTGF
jgi:hypothetical protein